MIRLLSSFLFVVVATFLNLATAEAQLLRNTPTFPIEPTPLIGSVVPPQPHGDAAFREYTQRLQEEISSPRKGVKKGAVVGAIIGTGAGALAILWHEYSAERRCNVSCISLRLGGGALIGAITGGLIGGLVSDPTPRPATRDQR